MKLQGLTRQLNQTAGDLARALAQSETCTVTPSEFASLIMTPDELAHWNAIAHRFEKITATDSIDVSLPEAASHRSTTNRKIRFTPHGLKAAAILNACAAAYSAPPELVARITEWYERRLTLGYLAGCFTHYASMVLDYCPSPGHVYRTWANATLLFTKSGMTQDEINEAMRVRPRDVAVIPREVQGLREPATQAAVLIEMLGLEPRSGKPYDRGHYMLDLPQGRKHLERHYPGQFGGGVDILPI